MVDVGLTNEELQFELDNLYETIKKANWTNTVARIVELEIELERRSNI